jgi:hypothetical protein
LSIENSVSKNSAIAVIILSSIFLAFVFYPNVLRSQNMLGSGLAGVKTKNLPFRSENFSTSEIVKVLKRGDTVKAPVETDMVWEVRVLRRVRASTPL